MARVLVADDDPDIRELIVFKLRQAGHDVQAFADGAAAHAAAQAAPPDLAVLDVAMPGMTGIAVCRALRESPETAAVPVLMLTAKAHESDVERGLAAGADDYLVKPFSPRELVVRVDAIIAGGGASGT
jgi:two-component system response regulator MtrA